MRGNVEDFNEHDTAGVIIHDHKHDGILMLYHKKYDLFTIPVGKIFEREDPKDGAIREIKEEIGLVVEDLELLWNGDVQYDLDNKTLQSKCFLYDAERYIGIPTNLEPDKHKCIMYMTLEQLEKSYDSLTEITKHAYQILKEKRTTTR